MEGHLHPCWGWIYDAQLGTADHAPASPALFVGSLGAGFKMMWLLLVQSLLGVELGGGCPVVEGCCAGRADTPLCARVC